MSETKRLVRAFLDSIEAGQRPTAARRTTFMKQADGAIARRVTRSNGTVEHHTRISAKRWADLKKKRISPGRAKGIREQVSLEIRSADRQHRKIPHESQRPRRNTSPRAAQGLSFVRP